MITARLRGPGHSLIYREQMLQTTVQRPSSFGQSESEGGLYSLFAEAARIVLRPSVFVGLLGVTALSLALAYAMVQFKDLFVGIGTWGYAAIFLVEAGNSAVILVPTPGPAYTAAMAAVLDPLLIGVVGGLGAAVGEMVGYTLGASGKHALEGGRLYARFKKMAEHRFGFAIFAFAALPLPFDIAGIWAGAVRYPAWRFFAVVAAGKTIKITLISFAVYYGLNAFGFSTLG